MTDWSHHPRAWRVLLAGAAVFAVGGVMVSHSGNARGYGYLAVAPVWLAASLYTWWRSRTR